MTENRESSFCPVPANSGSPSLSNGPTSWVFYTGHLSLANRLYAVGPYKINPFNVSVLGKGAQEFGQARGLQEKAP